MSTTRMPDGGPAFPVDNIVARDERGHLQGQEISSAGMSLRDHFAGLAMQGCIAARGPRGNDLLFINEADLAKRCYGMADEMLKARAAS